MKKVLVGTRDSHLALLQTRQTIDQLQGRLAGEQEIHFEPIPIKSKGDQITDIPLEKLEGKGFFTKELDQALLDQKIDIAVHSLKDLPTELFDELEIAAVTKRHDPRDVLIAHPKYKMNLKDLPPGAVLATGSLRRRSQLLVYRSDLNIVGLRGNLQTRYEKLKASDWDGMVLAGAGVERSQLTDTILERISLDIMTPAVGQGSLAIMIRKGHEDMKSLLQKIEDKEARVASMAERSFLRRVEGGCTSPIACLCLVEEDQIKLEAFIGSLDGKQYMRETLAASLSASKEEPEMSGTSLAEKMLKNGAREILNEK